GHSTLIRAYVDDNDFDQGFVYDISESASFYIPLAHHASIDFTPAATIKEIEQRIAELGNEGAFANEQFVRPLTMHLTAVGLFEQQGKPDKVVTHMENFKQFVEQMRVNERLNEQAYR